MIVINVVIFLSCILITKGDLVSDLNMCLESNEEIVKCLKIVVQSLKGFMKTGIPSAGLPPLDPLSLDNVEFSLGGANIEFRNVTMAGLSNHDIGDVTYDESKRILRLNLEIPKLRSRGRYSLTGKVLNVEGLDSEGPYRNEYSGITAIGTGSILQKGDTIEIGDMKIRLRIDDIKVHMECLFPKTGGPACCEKDRQFKSCNPILAKTIHRTINAKNSGSSIVERFQDEITGKVADITKEFLNSALSNVDSKYFF